MILLYSSGSNVHPFLVASLASATFNLSNVLFFLLLVSKIGSSKSGSTLIYEWAQFFGSDFG